MRSFLGARGVLAQWSCVLLPLYTTGSFQLLCCTYRGCVGHLRCVRTLMSTRCMPLHGMPVKS